MTRIPFDPNAPISLFECVLIYTLPEEHGIDGIIGLNFLRHFNIKLDFEHGILSLNPFR